MMKNIIITLLEEGILEEDIHRILDLIEEEYEINEVWGKSSGTEISGDDGVKGSDWDEGQQKRRSVAANTQNVTPDEYIKRGIRALGQKATKKNINHYIASRTSGEENRNKIEEYKRKIQDPNTEIDIPRVGDGSNNPKTTEGHQEGFHRAIAAKELGHKSIPMKVWHTTKREHNGTRNKKKLERREAIKHYDPRYKYYPFTNPDVEAKEKRQAEENKRIELHNKVQDKLKSLGLKESIVEHLLGKDW